MTPYPTNLVRTRCTGGCGRTSTTVHPATYTCAACREVPPAPRFIDTDTQASLLAAIRAVMSDEDGAALVRTVTGGRTANVAQLREDEADVVLGTLCDGAVGS